MKNLLAALALAGVALAGCAEEPAETPDPVAPEAEAVTEPVDDMMMEEDSTMMEGEMIDADTTMLDDAVADTTAM